MLRTLTIALLALFALGLVACTGGGDDAGGGDAGGGDAAESTEEAADGAAEDAEEHAEGEDHEH